MHIIKHFNKTRLSIRLGWLLATGGLLLTGTVYRIAASTLTATLENPVLPTIALREFPTEIGGWQGKDVSIPEEIRRVAGNDDFLYRFFVQEHSRRWASLYVAYSGRPGTMLGHRPDVCYIAGGWVYDNGRRMRLLSAEGRVIPCLIHRFHKPGLMREEIVVLNFYVLNGRITRSESGFSGLGWRRPNIAGDPARYVAQVQISSVLENSVLAAAKDMTDRILDFLPDENGEIKAAVK